jgi:hypothetical protein
MVAEGHGFRLRVRRVAGDVTQGEADGVRSIGERGCVEGIGAASRERTRDGSRHGARAGRHGRHDGLRAVDHAVDVNSNAIQPTPAVEPCERGGPDTADRSFGEERATRIVQ